MFFVLLIATFTATAWCLWAATRPPKCAQPPVETPPRGPTTVDWDEQTDGIEVQTDGIEAKHRMLDKCFAQYPQNDDDIDPPTVIARRR